MGPVGEKIVYRTYEMYNYRHPEKARMTFDEFVEDVFINDNAEFNELFDKAKNMTEVEYVTYIHQLAISTAAAAAVKYLQSYEPNGYHLSMIPRGIVGEFSKINEEFHELKDAVMQEDRIMQLCEMSDLIGAIESYAEKEFGMNIEDLIKFSNKTKAAFKSGKRS